MRLCGACIGFGQHLTAYMVLVLYSTVVLYTLVKDFVSSLVQSSLICCTPEIRNLVPDSILKTLLKYWS